MANTTWNPSDKEAGITLSGGNLTAQNSNNAICGIRAVHSQTTGKGYFEVTCTTFTGTQNAVGVASSSFSRTAFGNSTSGLTGNATVNRLGTVIVNGGTLLTIGGGGSSISFGTIANGTVICVAVDLTAKLIWFRLGAAGNWNNAAGRNPATGTGGVSMPSLGGTNAAFPCLAVNNTNDAATANFGDSVFVGAVPAGFTAGWPPVPAAAPTARQYAVTVNSS